MTMELKVPDFDALYFPPGEVIAERFKLAEKIGEGPFGQVYRAQDLLIEADVAIKVLEKDLLRTPLEEEAFLKATRRARALTQKNVVRLHDSGIHKDYPWVSMQFLEGLHLQKVVQLRHERRENFRVEELEPIIGQITLALQHVARDFAHGDLKPENIIFLPDLLKITDSHLRSSIPADVFARRNQKSPFIAPELLSDDGTEGIDDARCDVYSVGAIIAYMLFGEDYTPGDGANERGKRSAMDALCCRAMAFDPLERYPSVEALNEDFTSIIDTGARMDARAVVEPPENVATRPGPPAAPAPPPPPAPAPEAAEEIEIEIEDEEIDLDDISTEDRHSPFDEETPLDIGESPSELESTREFNRDDHRNDLGNLLPTNEVDRSEFPEPKDRPLPGISSDDDTSDDDTSDDDESSDGGIVAPPTTPPRASKAGPDPRPKEKESGNKGVFIIMGIVAVVILLAVIFGGNSTEEGVEEEPVAQVEEASEGDESPADGSSADSEAEAGESGPDQDQAAILAALEEALPTIPGAVTTASQAARERAEELALEAEAKAEEEQEDATTAQADTGSASSSGQASTATSGQGAAAPPDRGASAAPEPAPAQGTNCLSGMVLVRRGDGNVCVDAYEYPGRGQTPRTGVSWFDARRTCEGQGKRLCELSEWRSACGRSFPYGNRFDADRCNTADQDGFARSVASAGSFPQCRSSSGAFDMSGNVHEWVAEQQVAGGGFDSEADLASCRYSSAKAPGSADGNVGFRCCADPQ